MKTYLIDNRKGTGLGRLWGVAAVMLPCLMAVTGCVKDPDESNLYTFTGETITDYLKNRPEQYSSFTYILERVQMEQLLSSYGQYTCFAPTNDAVAAYVDSLYNDENNVALPHNGMTENSLAGLTDSLCMDIAKFHLSNSYVSTVDMSKGITISMMLSRTISAAIDPTTGSTMLNAASSIISKDNETTNGYVHGIDKVIPRSQRTMAEEMKMHKEYTIFYEALKATGLDEELMQTEKKGDLGIATQESGWWTPTTCKIGYTIFAETDDVLRENDINSLEDLYQHAIDVYGDCAETDGGWYDWMRRQGIEVSTERDFTNPYNVLNLWCRYHILNAAIPREYLIIDRHYTHELGSECYEYYETLLPKTLMKIWQVQGKLYINRYQTNNTLTNEVEGFGDIHVVEEEGVTLGSGATLLPINGYIHPVNGLLEYTAFVPRKVLNERMRFDIMSCIPELMTNELRWMSKAEAQNRNGGKSTSRARLSSKYCDNIRIYNTTTKLDYNFYDTGDYLLYQGDALRGNGVYDLAVKLPPVPSGNYELRICYPSVTDHGGMMQFYLGTSSEIADMQAVDIPIDLRLDFAEAPSIRWTFPRQEEDKGVATDEALKARGFMRGPLTYDCKGGTINARWGADGDTYHLTMRRIIISQPFEQKDYWLRVKSVLPDNTSGIFQVDYVEFAPTTVTGNTQYSEDMF